MNEAENVMENTMNDAIADELLLEGNATEPEIEIIKKMIFGEGGTNNPWDVPPLLAIFRLASVNP